MKERRRPRPLEELVGSSFGDGDAEVSSLRLQLARMRERPYVAPCALCGGEMPCAKHAEARVVPELPLRERALIVAGVVAGVATAASLIVAILVTP